MSGPEARKAALVRLVPWLALAYLMFWTFLWIGHPTDGAARDWSHFHDTARLILAGRRDEIYPGHTPGLPFLHPPYFVWLLVPFGWLSRTGGYLAWSAATVLAMAGALALLRRILPGDRRRFTVGVLVVLGSASWTAMMALGQASSFYLLILCAGLALWSRGARGGAGAILALMMLKPNLGAVFPLIFLLRRQGWVLLGWLLGFLVLVISTVPLGADVWSHYLTSLRSLAGLVDHLPPWRQHTLLAFWRSLGHSPAWPVRALWAASVAPLAALTGWAWLKTEPTAQNLPRLFGVTVLLIATASPYLHHYDALIVALPALVWYLAPGSYRSSTLRRICGGALATAYLFQQVSVWLIQGGWSLVGPALAVWLWADALDLIRGARSNVARPGPGPQGGDPGADRHGEGQQQRDQQDRHQPVAGGRQQPPVDLGGGVGSVNVDGQRGVALPGRVGLGGPPAVAGQLVP
jgi:hypothetical protein